MIHQKELAMPVSPSMLVVANEGLVWDPETLTRTHPGDNWLLGGGASKEITG